MDCFTLLLQQKQLQVAVCLVIITLGWASTENQEDLLAPNITLFLAVVLKFPMRVAEGQPQSCRTDSGEERRVNTMSTEECKGNVYRDKKCNTSKLSCSRTDCGSIYQGLWEQIWR